MVYHLNYENPRVNTCLL